MKKFIFNQLKSMQQNCLTFSCRLNAGFSRKLFFYGTLLFLVFSQTTLYSQILVQGATVQAKFGVDADLYANRLQFGPSGVTALGTDDWFLDTTSPGYGVIRQDSLVYFESQIQLNNNFSFERRMSVPKNTMVDNILWIDAVYGRDNNIAQGNKDDTKFGRTGDKNGDNPATWVFGNGDVPQKNDLIDVFGHLRRDSGVLWGFGGATTLSADGNSHTDFEYFRTDIEIAGTGLTKLGPDAGHTAWKFNQDGSVAQRGDLLIAIDFENGGTKPSASVRVWMSSADIANFNSNATHPERPFNLTGVFNGGDSSGVYGYAEITTKEANSATAVFAVVNVTGSTIGAPWGSLEGSKATGSDNIEALHFSEFGINLTLLGLDSSIDTGVNCENLLGKLMVKTRSSSSFTSELKDFAGPYEFGNTEIPVVQTTNLAECQTIGGNPAFTLSEGVVNYVELGTTFYSSPLLENGDPIIPAPVAIDPIDYIPATSPATIYVRTSTTLTGCYGYGSFTLTVKPLPTVSVNSPSICIGSSTTLTATTNAATPTYLWSPGNETTASITVSPTAQTTYTVTVKDGVTGCEKSGSGTVTINQNPSPPVVAYNPPACDETTFSITLSNVTNGATYTVTDKVGKAIPGITGLDVNDLTGTKYTGTTVTSATFGNIAAGLGYKVTVKVGDCNSDPSICASSTPPPIPGGKIAAPKEAAPIEAKTESAGFDAYPVPFKDQLTIKYNFDYESDVKIEVFNSQGVLVLSKTDTNSYLNKEIAMDLKLNRGKEQVYVVKVTTNRGSSTKKVISSR